MPPRRIVLSSLLIILGLLLSGIAAHVPPPTGTSSGLGAVPAAKADQPVKADARKDNKGKGQSKAHKGKGKRKHGRGNDARKKRDGPEVGMNACLDLETI